MHQFVSPIKIHFGEGSIQKISEECQAVDAKRVIIFADPFLVKSGALQGIEDVLQAADITYSTYDNIVPEPPIAVGDDAVNAVRNSQADLVLAVGGGSCMDLAKAAAVLAKHQGSVSDFLNLTGTKKLVDKGLPKILVPTTAGTGSEVTDIAVFSLETTKDVITHNYLLADVAIVDPELTYSVPPRVTAATGVDALTHAVEAFTSKNASVLTETLSLEAIRLISGSLRKAVQNGNNKEARRNMAIGSMIAGLAFFNAGCAGVHALAYPLGGLFHIPHGEANAVLLPYVYDFIYKSCVEKTAKIGEVMGVANDSMTATEQALATIDEFRRLIADVGLPSSLTAYGIQEKDIEALTNDGIKQTRLLDRSPKPFGLEDVRLVYSNALREIKMQ